MAALLPQVDTTTLPPQILPANSPSFSHQSDITLLSYNCLLPNSIDGWWIYKYYDTNRVPTKHTEWPHRKALLKGQLWGEEKMDVVCLQETCAESFETDFDFMIQGDKTMSC